MEKLKTCPHAGTANTGIYHDLRFAVEIQFPFILCSCGAAGAPGETNEEAVANWNRRPREEDLERLLREAVWWIRTYAPCGGKCDSCASATRMEDCDLHIDLAQFDAALKEGNHGSD
jgi:hypothetical protein